MVISRFFKEHVKTIVISGIVLILFIVILVTGSTVVSHEDLQNSASNNGEVDPATFANKSWESEVIPFFQEKQLDVSTVIKQLNEGEVDAVGESLGAIKANLTWLFIVNGSGKVLTVQDDSRRGTAEIDLEPFDGEADFVLAIGPVINGTSIRDSLDFIEFGDFNNQIEWSQLAEAFNVKSYEENLQNITFTEGLSVSFVGALAVSNSTNTLTPVEIQVVEGAD